MKEKSKVHKDLDLEIARLRESENRWRRLVENSPDHILTLARDLTIQSVNHPSPGLTIEELIGKTITSFLAEDRQVEIRAILQGVIDTGQAALYETEYPNPEGEVFYYETHAIPRKVDDRIEGLTLNSRDVTKRKRIENKLRQQGDLIQSIFLSAPVGIGMVSNRIILQANDRLCEMIGYKRDELINQNARMLYPTQEDFDYVGREKYDQISKAGTGVVETRFLRKDGLVIDVLLSSTPLDLDDLSAGVTFSALDITERNRAREEIREKGEKFSKLFDTMSSGVVVYDVLDNGEDFIIVDCNSSVETIEKVHKEDIIGKRVTHVFPGVKDFGLFEVFQRVSRTGDNEFFPLAIYTDENDPGSWRDNWVYKLPSGEIVAVYNDVTERRQAEKKLIDNENLLNATQKITKVGGWMWHVKNQNMFWTDETYRIHEIDPDQVKAGSSKLLELGMNCYDEKDRPIIMNAFQKCADEGIPYDLEFPFTTVTGNRKWIRTTAQAEKENGKIVSVIGNIADITETVQVQQALLTANNIINRSPATAILWKNEEGWPVEFVSENVEDLLGYSAHELSEGTLLYSEIIHSDDINRVFEEVNNASGKKNQRIIEHEPYRIITKNGSIKWIADKTYIQRDSRGDITHYEGIIYDMTKTVLVDLELRHRSDELATLLKTSRAVSSTLELENILQTTTDSIVEIIDIDSAAIYLIDGEGLYLGATTPHLDPQMPEDLRRADIADHPHLHKSITSKLPVFLEDATKADLTDEEQAIRDIRGLKSILYIPLQTGQQTLGALILGTTGAPRSFSQEEVDLCITLANQVAVSLQKATLHEELKKYSIDLEEQILKRNQSEKALVESEQNFRDLVGNLMDGLAITDENGFHIFINSRFLEITGYSELELAKMTTWDFTPKEDLDQLKQKMKQRKAGKLAEKNYERIIIRKDGKQIPVEMATSTTIWKGKKRPLIIIRDINERKEAEQQKDLLLKQVQEANYRLKSLSRELINSQEAERKRISQELHDELGQALTAISLDLGIIEQNIPSETPIEIKDRISDTKKNADGLDQMIRELALDLRPSLLDDLGLLPTLNWYLDKFSRRAEIDVRVEVIAEEKRLPSEIETALYRIIQEALTNVIKHAKAKKVDLQFDIRSDVVIVKIKDDGRGFDSGSLQLPDTPFLGLGLIGMADRTALVGGDLRIYSRPGEGTQIEIEIPL